MHTATVWKNYFFWDFLGKFQFLRRYLNRKVLLFCAFFFTCCASKVFSTPDVAHHEWMLLNVSWYDDDACHWTQGPNFCTYWRLPTCKEFLTFSLMLATGSRVQILKSTLFNHHTTVDCSTIPPPEVLHQRAAFFCHPLLRPPQSVSSGEDVHPRSLGHLIEASKRDPPSGASMFCLCTALPLPLCNVQCAILCCGYGAEVYRAINFPM